MTGDRGPDDGRADPGQVVFRALNRGVIPLLRTGVASPWWGLGLFLVETVGRVSGRPRPVPLLGHRLGDTVTVSTVRPDSQWVANLEASPEARVWLEGRPRPARARVGRLDGGGALVTLRVRPGPGGDRFDGPAWVGGRRLGA
ncbi:MAG: nitroreductase/quinone reductase family protein [Acidimicrobiales bacterium]